ncbi:MAG: beta-lactamase family protein [Ruminiclostridium sp.]|nr:beta-lactamase family protein [Ruminiclostridium sp.]
MPRKKLLISALAAAAILMCGCTDISHGAQMSVPQTGAVSTQGTAPAGIHIISPDDTTAAAEYSPTEYAMPDTDAYHERIEQIRLANGVTGMGIAVFRDGDIIYADSFGLADMEAEKPVTKNTRFRAASVSKLISTVLVMKMCDEEVITLDSILDTATGLPYSTASGDVKLRHLLTHTAGITDTYLYEWGMTERYPVDYVLKNSLTGTVPGEFYNYTNFGAGTMGAVIEHITGMFFHDYAEKVLFEPLGMDAGYIIDLIEDKESCAVIYDHDGEVFNVAEWGRGREYYESFGLGNSYLAAQCELLITPSDLARLGTALAGDGTVKECGGKRILSQTATDQMHGIYISTANYGMGLNVRTYSGNIVPGRTLCGHPGNALGAITGLFYDRSDRTGIAIMTNHCNYGMNTDNGMYSLLDDTVKDTYLTFFS